MKRGEKSIRQVARCFATNGLGQYGLRLAVCAALGVLSLSQIEGTHKPSPAYRNQQPLSLLTNRSTVVAEQTPPPTPAAPPPQLPQSLMPWHEPVEPIAIAPNSVPVINRIATTQPVVFLTIDDGVTKTPEIMDWLTTYKLPLTLFLDNHDIRNNYNFFRRLQTAGMTIQNHTMNHPKLTNLPLADQQAEICAAADTYKSVFDYRPTLMRPPYGLFNDTTRQAAACGMKAIVMWHARIIKGVIQYQEGDRLQPGDIVLMHFSLEFMTDIQAFINQIEHDHLQVGRLEDWLQ